MTLTVAVGGALSMVLKQLRAQWMYISWVSFLAWFVRLLCSNNQYNAGISNTQSNILYAQFNKMWPQSIVYCIVGAFYKLAKVLWIESAIKTKCPFQTSVAHLRAYIWQNLHETPKSSNRFGSFLENCPKYNSIKLFYTVIKEKCYFFTLYVPCYYCFKCRRTVNMGFIVELSLTLDT